MRRMKGMGNIRENGCGMIDEDNGHDSVDGDRGCCRDYGDDEIEETMGIVVKLGQWERERQ